MFSFHSLAVPWGNAWIYPELVEAKKLFIALFNTSYISLRHEVMRHEP